MQQQLYVIVQAGGRGSRLRHHTWNKPKCLVSVRGKPILYYLFDQFPDAKFIIISDYQHEQLKNYLNVNPPKIQFSILRTNEKGTASGISDAKKIIPVDARIVIAWSDLIIGSLEPFPENDLPVICTTNSFTCRWTVASEGHLHEQPGSKMGIPGLFYFPRASLLPQPPNGGEFVKWYASNVTKFETFNCPDIEELGDFSSIEKNNERSGFCRFFNKVELGDARVVKTVIDSGYKELHEKEKAWYLEAQRLGFRRIPKVYSHSPLTLERINGEHAYQMFDLTERERRSVMADYLDSLISLHDLGKSQTDTLAVEDVYIKKTIKRVESVSAIIPGFDHDSMTINGKKCKNIFSNKYKSLLQGLLPDLQPKYFVPIHGDATFSNTIIDNKLRVWFIDPRGYFSRPGIMGDAWYDFAKVYYSAVGGYDSFNRRKFKLHIDNETVEVLMEEPLFSKTAREIFSDYFGNEMPRIEILHGLIWLSLSGYAKDDIDSVIGSFYMGLYWLEIGTERI